MNFLFSFGFCVSEVKKKFNVKDRLFLMSLKMLGFMSYIVGVIVCLLFFFRHQVVYWVLFCNSMLYFDYFVF